MQIERCHVAFVESYPLPQFQLHPESISPVFRFLEDRRVSYPPPDLPVLRRLGKVTAISHLETEGVTHHHPWYSGVERVWACLYPYLPVQCVPQLDLETETSDAKLEHATLKTYIHPLGLVISLQGCLELPHPADGHRLAEILDRIERKDGLHIGCAALARPRNLAELFETVRNELTIELLSRDERKPAVPHWGRPFCVLGMAAKGQPRDAGELAGEPRELWELFCAVQRFTKGRDGGAVRVGRNLFVNAARRGAGRLPSGWVVGAKDGMAGSVEGEERHPERASRTVTCQNRNVARLIGFYKLYHAYAAWLAYQPELPVARATAEHIVNALDLMRVEYSQCWVNWATARLRLNGPLKRLAESHGIARLFPPHENAEEACARYGRMSPRVVIGYSGDNAAVRRDIAALIERLREHHVDAAVFEAGHDIDRADFILLACPAAEASIGGRGYANIAKNERVLPVVFRRSDAAGIPAVLERVPFFDVSTDDGFEELYRRVRRQPAVLRPLLRELHAGAAVAG